MATHVTPGYAPVEEGAIVRATRRISWGAIFAGVVIAVAVQLVMGILGTGIGLSMVDRFRVRRRARRASASGRASIGSSPRSSHWARAAMPRRGCRA